MYNYWWLKHIDVSTREVVLWLPIIKNKKVHGMPQKVQKRPTNNSLLYEKMTKKKKDNFWHENKKKFRWSYFRFFKDFGTVPLLQYLK